MPIGSNVSPQYCLHYSVGQNWPLNDGHEGVQEGMPNGDSDGLSCRFASVFFGETKRSIPAWHRPNGIEASN